MAISKELTQKVERTDEDSDEEDEEDEENMEDVEDKEYKENKEDKILADDKEVNVKTESEIDDFIKLCRKYYDKKRQMRGEKIERDETLDEIIPEKEKEISLQDENDSPSQANTKSNTKSKSRRNKKNSTLQRIENRSDTESKLCDNEKSDTSHANTRSTKSDACSNEKSNTSLTNTNDIKDKIPKGKRNKDSSICDYAINTRGVDICELSKQYSDCKNNKKSKSQDKNKISDFKGSIKENTKRKLNLKVQEVKKKFKANKTKKYEEEQKESEDYSSSFEFEDPKRKPILDFPLEETTSRTIVQKDSNLRSLKTVNTVQKPASTSYKVEIDPKKYINIKPKHLKTQLPDVATGGDENSEQEEETHRIMSEAFADDDVVEEFRKEKEDEVRIIRIFNKN